MHLPNRLRSVARMLALAGLAANALATPAQAQYRQTISNDPARCRGAGPAVNLYSFDESDDSETEAGFNILFGAETRRGLFFELKVGALDSPDVKFGVGWTFR